MQSVVRYAALAVVGIMAITAVVAVLTAPGDEVAPVEVSPDDAGEPGSARAHAHAHRHAHRRKEMLQKAAAEGAANVDHPHAHARDQERAHGHGHPHAHPHASPNAHDKAKAGDDGDKEPPGAGHEDAHAKAKSKPAPKVDRHKELFHGVPEDGLAASFAESGFQKEAAPVRDAVALQDGYVPKIPVAVHYNSRSKVDRAKFSSIYALPDKWPRSEATFRPYLIHTFTNACVGEQLILFGVPADEQQKIAAEYERLAGGPHRKLLFRDTPQQYLDDQTERKAGAPPRDFFYIPGTSMWAAGSLRNIMHTFFERGFRLAVNAVLGVDDHFVDQLIVDNHFLSEESQFTAATTMATVNLVHRIHNKGEGRMPPTYVMDRAFVCGDRVIVNSSHERTLFTPSDYDQKTLRVDKKRTKVISKLQSSHKDDEVHEYLHEGFEVLHDLREMLYGLYGIQYPERRTCLRKAVVYDHSNSFHSVIVNGQQITDVLSTKYGLDVVFYHDLNLDFASTIDLMADTDLFLAPAGGVMMDVILLPPGAAVIEVTSPGHFSWIGRYRLLAYLDLHHIAIESTAVPITSDAKHMEAFGKLPEAKLSSVMTTLGTEVKPCQDRQGKKGAVRGPIGA